ncbi:MAG TPA: hypothetical protein VD948_13095 [Rhodothermales bacterium]|nr:hypothetical protein [Rhodothermales bacterium]
MIHSPIKVTNPGLNGTATLFDEVILDREKGSERALLMVRTNVADAAYVHQWAEDAAGTLRTVETATIAADTMTPKTFSLWPGRNVIKLTTVTAPTTWQAAFGLSDAA